MECVCVPGVLVSPPPPHHSGLSCVGVSAWRVEQVKQANVYLFLLADCAARTSSQVKGFENKSGILGRTDYGVHALRGTNGLVLYIWKAWLT